MIDRNLVLINEMKRVLAGEITVEKGKKPVKPQDLVRLFENIIQVITVSSTPYSLKNNLHLQIRFEST